MNKYNKRLNHLKLITSVVAFFIGHAVFGTELPIVVDQSDSIRAADLKPTSTGVPQVDIVAPGNGGLSHNKFTNYNVSNEGVVVNNSRVDTCTEDMGCVSGNRNFGVNPHASTVLFEVTGASQSQIEGATRIVGPKADFILVNPNGVVCNGGKFINTGDVTVSGVSVDGLLRGDVQIEGLGVETEGDKIRFLGDKVKVDGPVRAKRIAEFEAIAERKGEEDVLFAVDVGELGSISAGSIYMVATGKGVGVRSRAKLKGGNGDGNMVEIKTDEKIELSEAVEASGISLHAKSIDAQKLAAPQGMELYTGDYNVKSIFSDGYIDLVDWDVNGDRSLAFKNATFSGNGVLRFAGLNFKNSGPVKLRGAHVNVTGNSFFNDDLNFVVDNEFSYVGPGSFINEGKMTIGGHMYVRSDSFLNEKKWNWKSWDSDPSRNEQVGIGGSGEITAASIDVETAAGDIINQAGGVIRTTSPTTNSLRLVANRLFENLANKRFNEKGEKKEGFDFQKSIIESAGDAYIQAKEGHILNYGSLIEIQGDDGGLELRAKTENINRNAEGSYFSHIGTVGHQKQKHGFCRLKTRYVPIPGNINKDEFLAAEMIAKHNPSIVSETSDVIMRGANIFFGDRATIQAGKDFINDGVFVHNDQGVGGGSAVHGNLLGSGMKSLAELSSASNGNGLAFYGGSSIGGTGSGGTFEGGNVFFANGAAITVGTNGQEGQVINNAGSLFAEKENIDIWGGDLINNGKSQVFTDRIDERSVERAIAGRIGAIGTQDGAVNVHEGKLDQAGGFLSSAQEMQIRDGMSIESVPVLANNEYHTTYKKLLTTAEVQQTLPHAAILQSTVLAPNGIIFGDDAEVLLVGGTYMGKKTMIHGKSWEEKPLEFELIGSVTRTDSGFKIPGVGGIGVALIDGKSMGVAVSENIALAKRVEELFRTESATDLAPAMNLIIGLYNTAEGYGQYYKSNGGDSIEALSHSAADQLGLYSLDMPLPNGASAFKQETITTTKTKHALPSSANVGYADMELDKIVLEGSDFKAEGGSIEAEEVQLDSGKTRTQTHTETNTKI